MFPERRVPSPPFWIIGSITIKPVPKRAIPIPTFSLKVTCSLRIYAPAVAISKGLIMVIIVSSKTVVFSSPKNKNPREIVEVRSAKKRSFSRVLGRRGKCSPKIIKDRTATREERPNL